MCIKYGVCLLRGTIIILLAVFIFTMYTPSCYADLPGEIGIISIAAVIIGVLIIAGIIWWISESSHKCPDNSGEMFFTVTRPGQGNLTGWTSPSGGDMKTPSDLNINCMLTDRNEGQTWISTGFTFRLPADATNPLKDLMAYGLNIEFGRDSGNWKTMLHMSLLTEDQSYGMLEVAYSY